MSLNSTISPSNLSASSLSSALSVPWSDIFSENGRDSGKDILNWIYKSPLTNLQFLGNPKPTIFKVWHFKSCLVLTNISYFLQSKCWNLKT